MQSDGRRLLSALVYGQDLKMYGFMRLSEEMFKGGEVLLFKAINDHVSKFGKIPSVETIQEMGSLGESLVEISEPPEYYLERVQKRFLHTKLKEVILVSQAHLKNEDPTKAFEALMVSVGSLLQQQNRQHLFDFRDAAEIVYNEYVKVASDTGDYSLHYGWPYLDEMTGGMREGDFTSIVGRPAAGKTFMLLYSAHFNWKHGHRPLFVSMEMSASTIIQRLASMHTSKGLTKLLKAVMSTKSWNEMQTELLTLAETERPLWVVDGNLATNLDDIVMHCRQLKPSAVYVDGAYLLRPPKGSDKKASRWDLITDNAEGMKMRIATDMGLPTVASYQFKREVTKKKKDEKTGVQDIFGSDAIGQLSTVSIGMFEEESIETMQRRRADVLKGRNGEVGQFHMHWNFDKMDFSQIVKEDITQMQFLG